MACSTCIHSSGFIAIALIAFVNLQTNLCSGVHGSWQPQHLSGSVGLIGIGLGGCGLLGMFAVGKALGGGS
jgi:hypothetical protein